MRSKEDLKYLFYHKNSKSECIHKPPPQLNYSIPCINCDCLIPSTDVDSHSQICQNSSVYKYSNITEYAAVQETDLKIKKLRQSIMLQYVQETLPQNKKYLMRSEELCNTILQIRETDEKSIKYLSDIQEELKLLIETYKGILLVQLFLERLHSLSLVKLSNLKSIIKLPSKRTSQESTSSTQLSKKVNNFQQNIQTENQKNLSIKYNQHQRKSSNGYLFNANETTQSMQEKIFRKTQITKFSQQQQMFNIDLKSEILTRISSSQCEEEHPIHDQNKEDQLNQLQRLFYSKCLNLKAKLPNTHPAQRIPLCVLHKEALNRNIQIQRWDEFIAEAYQRPEIFLDVQKLQNKQSPYQFQLSTRQILCNNNLKERIKNLKVL